MLQSFVGELTQISKRIMIDGMEFLSVDEAAKLTGYSTDHLRRLIRQKKVGAIKKGTMYWVDEKSLMEYKKNMDELGTDKHFQWREK